MADVKIRKLPERVVGALKLRASAAGRSLEEELREVLTEAASRPARERAAEMSAFQNMLRRKYGEFSDSTPAIRADRGACG
jgi:plasmid stability protein